MNRSASLRRLTAFAAAAFTASFFLAYAQDKPAAPAGNEPAPKQTVPVREHNAGKVNKGAAIEYEFVIKNTGKGKLVIEKAQPSCGCTVPTFDKEVAPGAEGKIKAVVKTENLGFGPQSKRITVTTNDPVEPNFTLTVNLDVTAAIRVLPKDNLVFSARVGEGDQQKLVLQAQEGKPFTVRSVTTDSEFLDAKYERVTGKMTEVGPNLVANKDDYVVTVTLSRNTPPGYLTGRKVVIKTDSKEMPEVDVRVSARVTETPSPAAPASASK